MDKWWCPIRWVLSFRARSEIWMIRPAEPRKCGAGERTWNHTVDSPNRRAPYLPPSVSLSPPFRHGHLHHHRLLASTPPSLLHRGRPVALIIREYIAVMLSIPPANSNRVYSPTWWYRQEKWPHALQSQHFCVGCGRERGSSPRTRGSERERFFECLGERLPCVRGPPRSTADFTLVSTGAACHRNRPGTWSDEKPSTDSSTTCALGPLLRCAEW